MRRYIADMTLSYWHLKNNFPGSSRSADLERVYDIAIVGAGIVGLGLGYFLCKMGCTNVIVLEKKSVGYGASGRNAGFLISGMAESYSRLVVGMGRTWAKALTDATLENYRLIENSIVENSIDCDYKKSGSFHLAVSDTENRELEESVSLLHLDGFEAEYIKPADVEGRLGFGNYTSAYYNPCDGCLDPYAFVLGLSKNLNVAENFDVRSINSDGGHVVLKGAEATVKAEMVVMATNAYSPLLDDFFKNLIFPVRGQMLAVAPKCRNSLKDGTYYANFGYDYFRQPIENVIVMGGLRDRFIASEIGYEDSTTSELQSGLENYIRDSIGVEKFDVTGRWSGVMGNTIDGLPLVGALPLNNAVIAVVGCNGHGFSLGMIMARDLARALLRGDTSELLSRFSLKRFLK